MGRREEIWDRLPSSLRSAFILLSAALGVKLMATDVIDERNRRRSERIVLRIPVHLSALLPSGKRISVEAQTLLVNAHGGLLDIGVEMITGQQICLSNWSTDVVVTAKVLSVERSEEGRFSVAFEFESPSPHFWPVSSPPRDWSVVTPKVRIL